MKRTRKNERLSIGRDFLMQEVGVWLRHRLANLPEHDRERFVAAMDPAYGEFVEQLDRGLDELERKARELEKRLQKPAA